nr:branched-chain amino acid ABC transporter permease [Campylobacteraceae bacterium]
MQKNKIINLLFFIGAIGFIFVADNMFEEYTVHIINNIAIFIILAVSYNLINGVTGQFSLEPNGFVAIGAYVAALLLLDADAKVYQYDIEDPASFILGIHYTNFLVVLFLSGLISSLLALFLAAPV